MSDTPETDKAFKYWPSENAELVEADFARKLERERDEWAALCGQYKAERDEANCKMADALQEVDLCGQETKK